MFCFLYCETLLISVGTVTLSDIVRCPWSLLILCHLDHFHSRTQWHSRICQWRRRRLVGQRRRRQRERQPSTCSWHRHALSFQLQLKPSDQWTALDCSSSAHYWSVHWPTRERLPLPTSVSSYPAFQCSRCTWYFCPHAHWGWFLAVPA